MAAGIAVTRPRGERCGSIQAPTAGKARAIPKGLVARCGLCKRTTELLAVVLVVAAAIHGRPSVRLLRRWMVLPLWLWRRSL